MAIIGLSEHEKDAFSITRAVRALAFPQNRQYQRDAEFEFDVSTEAAKVEKRDIGGIFIPDDVLKHKSINQRILTAGVDSAGGHTVDDELQSIIDIFLENNFAADNVSVLSGLKGNVFIPGQDERIEAQFVGETEAATEDDASFREISLTPRHCKTWLRVSKQLLVQSHESVEGFLRRDLSRAIAKKVDKSILYGVGTAEDMSVASVTLDVESYADFTTVSNFKGLTGKKWTFATVQSAKLMLFKDLVAADETKLGALKIGTQITFTTAGSVATTVTVSGAYDATNKRLPIDDYDATTVTDGTDYAIATVAVDSPATFDPMGIVNTSDIQTFNWNNDKDIKKRGESLVDQVLSMEERLAAENVPGASGRTDMPVRNCSILMSNRMKRLMKLAQFFGENTEFPLLSDDDMLLGEYKANYSTQVNLHDFFFCDWKDALLGLWSGIEIMENPYTEDTKGIIRISVDQMLDVNVYRPKSMAYATVSP